MLKFEGEELYTSPSKRFSKKKLDWRWNEAFIPTVDEVDEFNASSYKDTILQILHGQAISFGYDVERSIENEVNPFRGKLPTGDKKVKVRIKKVRVRIKAPKFTREHKKFVRLCMIGGKHTFEEAKLLAMQLLGA